MTPELVQAVAECAAAGGFRESELAALRAQFRGIHLSFCNDDDVIQATPHIKTPGMNVYLVDGRNHCLTLTQNLEAATGLLLAEVNDGDES